MPAGKHRQAPPPRRGRSLPRPHLGRLVGRLTPRRAAWLVAPLATLAIVGGGIAVAGSDAHHHDAAVDLAALAPHDVSAANAAGSISGSALSGATRSQGISRSLDRIASTTVTGHQWSTADLNLYLAPADQARVAGEFPSRKRIGVTGQRQNGFAQVVVHGQPRWVHSDYLSEDKPDPDPAQLGLVFKPCPATASVENGLVPDAVRAWEAVCNQFPQVSTYGGVAPRTEHNTGHAIDAMVYGDSSLGYRIAEFLQAHASELNLYDIIYRQHIWTPVRASEGWRLMPDRGSPTANHMDHVHFAVN